MCVCIYIYIYIFGIIIPTDFHIFQRGRYTTNQKKDPKKTIENPDCNYPANLTYGKSPFSIFNR